MADKIPTYIGWYQPHASYDWTGLVPDPKTGELVKEESMTKQSFKDECDVNNILRQYSPVALAQMMAERAALGRYADLPSNLDFQEAMNIVVEGKQAFESLPSQIRERFMNDPERFLAFMSDADNVEEAIKLGLAVRRVEPEPEPTLADQVAEAIQRTTGGDGGSPPSKGPKAP